MSGIQRRADRFPDATSQWLRWLLSPIALLILSIYRPPGG